MRYSYHDEIKYMLHGGMISNAEVQAKEGGTVCTSTGKFCDGFVPRDLPRGHAADGALGSLIAGVPGAATLPVTAGAPKNR